VEQVVVDLRVLNDRLPGAVDADEVALMGFGAQVIVVDAIEAAARAMELDPRDRPRLLNAKGIARQSAVVAAVERDALAAAIEEPFDDDVGRAVERQRAAVDDGTAAMERAHDNRRRRRALGRNGGEGVAAVGEDNAVAGSGGADGVIERGARGDVDGARARRQGRVGGRRGQKPGGGSGRAHGGLIERAAARGRCENDGGDEPCSHDSVRRSDDKDGSAGRVYARGARL
jgi:hypothetical protein